VLRNANWEAKAWTHVVVSISRVDETSNRDEVVLYVGERESR
jgi:hypothetical protein